jgi:hypothetical protein
MKASVTMLRLKLVAADVSSLHLLPRRIRADSRRLLRLRKIFGRVSKNSP